MVPAYQLFADIALAFALLTIAIYSPFLLKKRLPRWAEIGMAAFGAILMCGVIYALLNGHWPFQG